MNSSQDVEADFEDYNGCQAMWKVFSSFGPDFDWRNNVLMPSEDRLEGKAFGKRFAVHTVGEKLGRGHPIGQCDCWSFVVAKGFRSTFFPGPYRPLGPSTYG